uniref:centromere protein U isoform X2 n=1 Tax=Semicossyphus pulcher TaxID=241346 RepID=UPI0037E89ED4
MSARKGRRAKALKVDSQKGSAFDNMESPDLSTIERTSFMERLQQNFGNPLHSTAMEEDLDVLEGQKDEGKAGRKGISKTFVKQRGAAVKRKETEKDAENGKEEEKRKRSRRSTGGNGKVGAERDTDPKKKKGAPLGQQQNLDEQSGDSDPYPGIQRANSVRQLVGKKSAKRRSAGRTSAARQVKNQQGKKDKKRESESGGEKSNDPQPQDKPETGTVQQTQRSVLSSDEEVGDEDTSWPSPKKAKTYTLGRTRKSSSDGAKSGTSSSGSASDEQDKDKDKDKQRRKKQVPQRGTELEVVLDSFTDFCDQYRESVESKAVKQSIDSFATNVKQQLMEKISSYKELKVLQKENVKVGSSIRKKTQRLLDAKHEMMRVERQVWLLKKEKAELKLRLADLRRGKGFLHDIRELNRLYLDYRHKHPKKKETYGASSLPALQLETKKTQAAGHQRDEKNNRLEKRQKKKGTQK